MLIAITISPGRWLSWAVFYAVFVVNLVLDAWLLTVLYKQGVRKRLPWFVVFIVWELLLTSVELTLWIANRRLYAIVYWWMEGPRMVLIVGAVRESFLRIFEGFTSKRGFRWSVWGVIAAVLLYSTWKAIYAPPVQNNRLIAYIVGTEFAFRWGIAAIGLLTMVLMYLLDEPLGTREGSVVIGFGIYSIAFLLLVLSRSLFGTRFIFFTQYLPSVGYFFAARWWIKVFSRPVEEFGFKELGMGPEDIAKELSRYRELAERLMRKIR
jgi:hypothetical protein